MALVAEPKQILTQNGHLRSFKVIYMGIIEEPLMGYIAQYNKCGLRCEDSEDIAREKSENLHFRPPHSHLTPPLQRTPANICIKLILLETRIPGLNSKYYFIWFFGTDQLNTPFQTTTVCRTLFQKSTGAHPFCSVFRTSWYLPTRWTRSYELR